MVVYVVFAGSLYDLKSIKEESMRTVSLVALGALLFAVAPASANSESSLSEWSVALLQRGCLQTANASDCQRKMIHLWEASFRDDWATFVALSIGNQIKYPQAWN